MPHGDDMQDEVNKNKRQPLTRKIFVLHDQRTTMEKSMTMSKQQLHQLVDNIATAIRSDCLKNGVDAIPDDFTHIFFEDTGDFEKDSHSGTEVTMAGFGDMPRDLLVKAVATVLSALPNREQIGVVLTIRTGEAHEKSGEKRVRECFIVTGTHKALFKAEVLCMFKQEEGVIAFEEPIWHEHDAQGPAPEPVNKLPI